MVGPVPARCLRPESEVQWGQGPCSARAPPPWLPPRAGQPAAPGVRPIPSSKPAAARQAELPGPEADWYHMRQDWVSMWTRRLTSFGNLSCRRRTTLGAMKLIGTTWAGLGEHVDKETDFLRELRALRPYGPYGLMASTFSWHRRNFLEDLEVFVGLGATPRTCFSQPLLSQPVYI